MIVLSDKPGIITLPYILDGKQCFFDFTPGKNEISPDVWKAIVSQNKARMDNCHSKFLRVFQPKVEHIEHPEEDLPEGDLPLDIEIGEEGIDFPSLSTHSALDLIENTMQTDELNEYLSIEKQSKRPRKVVVKAIEDKIFEIEEFEKKRQEGKEKEAEAKAKVI